MAGDPPTKHGQASTGRARPAATAEARAAVRRSMVATAIVAAALAACVIVLQAVNYARLRATDPMDNPQLAELRGRVHRDPSDERTRNHLRDLDQNMRTEYFRRQRYALNGGLLLAGFVAISAGAALAASLLGAKLPRPTGLLDLSAEQRRRSAWGRWSVAAFAVVLAGVAMVLAARSERILSRQLIQDAPSPDDQAPAYPTAEQIAANWPRFRGPGGRGVSAYANVPYTWDGKAGRGIVWQSFIPLPGQNSPVLWGDRVFLTGADPASREVYCYAAQTGTLLWQAALDNIPPGRSEPPRVADETGYAAPTAVTDGRRVYAIFANGDLAALDYDGRRVWARNLGMPESAYGYSSSLAMYRDLLFVQFDQGDQDDDLSEMFALDAATGRTVWSAKRPVAGSWATPIVIAAPTGDQLITCAAPWVIAYQPTDGREIWKAKCLEGDVAPSPIYAGGLVLAIVPDVTVFAIRTDGQGDVTDTHIAWQAHEGVPDIVSPASDGKTLLLLTTQGLLTCYDLADGRKLYEQELAGDFRSSPTCVAGRVYILADNGTMYVIASGDRFELLATAELGERAHCSPAFADGRIYIRGEDNLFCIGFETK